MSKLSDALHGAAENAPVDGSQVSAVHAARRVSRRRALRTGVPGVVGAGAIALLTFGVVIPNLGRAGSAGDESTGALPGADWATEESGGAADSSLAFGMCGSMLEGGAYGEPAATLDVALLGDGEELQGGGTVTYRSTLTGTADGTFTTFGADAFVLWDGIVVGTAAFSRDQAAELSQVAVTDGMVVDIDSELALVNCWDGEALPAGSYELVVSQEFWAETVVEEPPVEPTDEGTPEPDFPVDPDTTDPVDPTAAPEEESTDPVDPSSDETTTNDSADASGVADESAGSTASGPAASAASFRIVSEPLDLLIAGEPVDDPFASYLYSADPGPVETPDDLLTPDEARGLYDGAVVGAWDMAPGTQRVVLTGDSTDTDGSLWEQRYYGCSWDGGAGDAFPESADLRLLDVAVDVPSSVSVSYGWVVDDNPLISASMSNASDYTLPYWGGPQPTLYLVRDGVVVAEAYLNATAREGEMWILEDAVSSDLMRVETGYLAPGDGYAGEYLWRDVNGCWTETGQTPITSGTYTVLAAHTVHVDTGVVYYGYDDALSADEAAAREAEAAGGGTSSSDGSDAMDEPAIGIDAADDYDWVELQVWTSLGTIRVTAN